MSTAPASTWSAGSAWGAMIFQRSVLLAEGHRALRALDLEAVDLVALELDDRLVAEHRRRSWAPAVVLGQSSTLGSPARIA